MNEKTDFNSTVVVVQPIDKGMVDALNAQDCLYHVNLQGLNNGEMVNSFRMIDVISRALNPYSQYNDFMALAEQPEMRFVISNTTEQVSTSIRRASSTMLQQVLIPAS